MHQVFSGIKVVELANVLAGPSVGMFFAELGATVIKVENKSTGGDITRGWKVATEERDAPLSAYYHSINYGKTSLLLDLKVPADLAVAQAHIRDADIVISNFSDATAERMHLDYPTLAALNPRLIYAQLYAFSDQNDPRPAFDIVLQAEAGLLSMCGHADTPARLPVAFIDLLAGHQLKEAVLIALLRREKTGHGGRVTTSLMETAVASLANQASNWLHAGYLPKRMGVQHPNIAPYGDIVYSSDQKPIVLAVGTEQQFEALCEVLNMRHWLQDPAFSTNTARVQNRDALIAAIQTIVGGAEITTWMSLFAAHGIPAGKVNDLQEVFEQEFAQKMVLTQTESDGTVSKRVRTVAFTLEL